MSCRIEQNPLRASRLFVESDLAKGGQPEPMAERRLWVDLTSSPSRRRTAGICAKETAGGDVKRSSRIAENDRSAGIDVRERLGEPGIPIYGLSERTLWRV